MSPPAPLYTLQDYKNRRLIGQGTFAEVHKAENMLTKEDVVLKVAKMPMYDGIRKEFDIMRSLDHPNILRANRLVHCGPGIYGIELECCDTDLDKDKARKAVQSDLGQLINATDHIAQGVDHIHDKGIIHADLKPENILQSNDPLNNQNYPRSVIADFGFAERLTHDCRFNVKGTPGFLAPELKNRDSNWMPRDDGTGFHTTIYRQGVDIYSLGATVKLLLDGQNDSEYQEEREELEEIFVSQCQNVVPSERPDAKDVLKKVSKVKLKANLKKSKICMLEPVSAVHIMHEVAVLGMISGRVEVRNLNSGSSSFVNEDVHTKKITCIASSGDSLAISSEDGTVSIWNMQDQQCLSLAHSYQHEDEVYCLAMNKDILYASDVSRKCIITCIQDWRQQSFCPQPSNGVVQSTSLPQTAGIDKVGTLTITGSIKQYKVDPVSGNVEFFQSQYNGIQFSSICPVQNEENQFWAASIDGRIFKANLNHEMEQSHLFNLKLDKNSQVQNIKQSDSWVICVLKAEDQTKALIAFNSDVTSQNDVALKMLCAWGRIESQIDTRDNLVIFADDNHRLQMWTSSQISRAISITNNDIEWAMQKRKLRDAVEAANFEEVTIVTVQCLTNYDELKVKRTIDESGALIEAASKGNLEIVEHLLSFGADVDQRDGSGRTPLMQAARYGHTSLVSKLLSSEADVQAEDEVKESPLSRALQGNHLETAKQLRQHGAPIDHVNKLGYSCLVSSIRKGQTDVVKFLIANGADANETDQNGNTVLSLATERGHKRIAMYLIDNGADIDQVDSWNQTALLLALKKGHDDLARYLIERGARINITSANGLTPLIVTAEQSKLELFKLLLENGADLDADDAQILEEFEPQSLHSHRQIRVAKCLEEIEKYEEAIPILGRAIESISQTCGHNHPFTLSLKADLAFILSRNKSHHLETFSTLIPVLEAFQHGGQIDGYSAKLLVENLSRTLESWARPEYLERLQRWGEDQNMGENIGCFQEQIQFTEDKLNFQDENGWTSLHHAAVGNDSHLLELLFNQDSLESSLLNNNSQTPYTLARERGNDGRAIQIEDKYKSRLLSLEMDLISILKKGCLTNLQCCKGVVTILDRLTESLADITDPKTRMTALSFAAKNGHVKILEHFLQINSSWTDTEIPPLIWQGCNNNQPGVIKVLLSHEGTMRRWNEEAQDGTNALTVALLKNFTNISDTLMECQELTNRSEAQDTMTKFGHFRHLREEQLDIVSHCQLAINCEDADAVEILFKQLSSEQKSRIWKQSSQIQSNRIRHILGLQIQEEHSDLIKLTRQFPVFNSSVCKNKVDLECKDNTSLNLSAVKKDVLGDFCCISDHLRTKLNRTKPIFIKDVKLSNRCIPGCQKKNECRSVNDMIALCQRLETRFNNRHDLMAKLNPRLVLIGSVAEGTRIGMAQELDVTVKFKGLSDKPLIVGDNATEVTHPDELLNIFKTFNQIFSYAKFLQWFLEEVKSCLLDIRHLLPRTIDLFLEDSSRYEDCPDCKDIRRLQLERSAYAPYTHCSNHLLTVTSTRLGGCLVFKWNDRVNCIDLIPVFPILPKGTFDLYRKMTSTLMVNQYPTWLKFLNGFMKRCVILPEAFAEQPSNSEEKYVCYVGLKILHYGKDNNYIIRPAQRMIITDFYYNQLLKDVYIHIKLIKNCLNVDVQSYFIKKVLLLPDFVAMTKKKNSSSPHVNISKFIFEALSHPELMRRFASKIDFQQWSLQLITQESEGTIPLCRTNHNPEPMVLFEKAVWKDDNGESPMEVS